MTQGGERLGLYCKHVTPLPCNFVQTVCKTFQSFHVVIYELRAIHLLDLEHETNAKGDDI